MGKPRTTLKSSMKAIHEAFSSFLPTAPVCMQQSRTDSFRDNLTLLSKVHSIYRTAPRPSLLLPPLESPRISPPYAVADELRIASSSCCSSSSSSSVVPDATALAPVASINSRRFFFSPRTTSSIMEEAKVDAGTKKMESLSDPTGGFHMGTKKLSPFCEESVPLVVASRDPYMDFRMSMEEMVEAHGISEWSGLQELLDCYLQLNDENTHRIILLAFVDLLMCLADPEGPSFSSSSLSSSTALQTSPSNSTPFLHLSSD